MTTVEFKKQDREINIQTDKVVTDEATQKKYYVAELARRALNQYLDYDNLFADNSCSIYTLPIVNELTDFIDFEINSLSVHVVPTIDKGKNKYVYIPKSYRMYNCKPDIIIFVNFNSTFTKMTIDGFVKDIDLSATTISKTSLIPTDDLIVALKTLNSKNISNNDNVVQVSDELMLAFVDSSLSEEGEQFFLKHIVSNKKIREHYKLFFGFNSKFYYIAKQHKALSDESFVAVDSLPKNTEIEEIVETDNSEHLPINFVSQEVEVEDFDSTFTVGQEETADDFNDISSVEEETYAQVDELLLNSEEPVKLLEDTKNSDDVDTEIISESQTSTNQEEFSAQEYQAIDEPLISAAEVPEKINALSEDDGLTELDFSDFNSDELLSLDSDIGELSLQDEKPEDVEKVVDEQALEISDINEADVMPQNQEITLEEPQEVVLTAQEDIAPSGEDLSEDISGDSDSGEDLFSFLSEMADEVSQEEQSEPAILEQEQELVEETQNIEEQDVQYEENNEIAIEHEAQEVQDTHDAQDTQEYQEEATAFDNAFQDVSEVQQEFQTAEVENTQKPALAPSTPPNMRFAAVVAVLLIAGGLWGVYANKDKIPFLNHSQEISGLSEEKNNVDNDNAANDLPAPISDLSTVDTNVPQNSEAPNVPTAPAPDAVDTNTAAPKVVQENEKTTPDLPSLPTSVEPPKPKHLNDAIATALSKDYSGVRISKVSWEVSETLLNNSDVKTYLTIAGKSIKNALAQDLMAATEPSFKDAVSVNIIYKKDGSISQVRIISSSGSNQIDEIIAKSIKNTLNYIKMPSLNLDKPEYTAKLIVRL